jgi:hypothetical protein
MGRPAGTKQFSCVMLGAMKNELDAAAIALRVEGEPTESLDRGRMARALFRWFLSRSEAEKRRVIAEGWDVADDLDQRRKTARGIIAAQVVTSKRSSSDDSGGDPLRGSADDKPAGPRGRIKRAR